MRDVDYTTESLSRVLCFATTVTKPCGVDGNIIGEVRVNMNLVIQRTSHRSEPKTRERMEESRTTAVGLDLPDTDNYSEAVTASAESP